jgi:hypothetical protein
VISERASILQPTTQRRNATYRSRDRRARLYSAPAPAVDEKP